MDITAISIVDAALNAGIMTVINGPACCAASTLQYNLSNLLIPVDFKLIGVTLYFDKYELI